MNRILPVLLPISLGIAASGVSAATYSFDLTIVDQDVEPSTTGEVVSFGAPIVNNQGEIAVITNIRTASGITSEIRRYASDNSFTVVARLGDPAPDTGGATYSTFANLSLNNNGVVAWQSGLSGPETANTNIGVFTGINTGLQNRIVQDGDPVPGSTRTVKLFDDPFLRRFEPVIADNGNVYLNTRVSTPGSTILSDDAILTYGTGSGIVAIEGDNVIGTSRLITDFGIEPRIFDGGNILTAAGLDFSDDALVRIGSLGIEKFAEDGDTIDGFTLNEGFFPDNEVAGTSTTGFIANANGFTDVFFADFNGALEAQLAEGDPAPVDNGVLNNLSLMGITDTGEALLWSTLTGDSGNSSLIYFRDSEGDLSPVFWSEDTFEVDGQALSLATLGLNFSGSRMLTDFQSTAFSLDLLMPGGGFRSVLVRAQGDVLPDTTPVPLPASGMLMLGGLAIMATRRRKV